MTFRSFVSGLLLTPVLILYALATLFAVFGPNSAHMSSLDRIEAVVGLCIVIGIVFLLNKRLDAGINLWNDFRSGLILGLLSFLVLLFFLVFFQPHVGLEIIGVVFCVPAVVLSLPELIGVELETWEA